MLKQIVTIFILLQLAFHFSLAVEHAHSSEKEKTIEMIGKKIRRSYYVQGHGDVSSTVTEWKKTQFQSYLKNRSNEETPLDIDQEKSILTCFKDVQCDVYLYEVSTNYRGGFGMINHWVLLNSDNSYFEIIHSVYTE